MEEILHLLIGSLSHHLQGFYTSRWLFGISSINSITIDPISPDHNVCLDLKKGHFLDLKYEGKIWPSVQQTNSFKGILEYPLQGTVRPYEPGSKLLVLGMVIQPLIGNPYNGAL